MSALILTIAALATVVLPVLLVAVTGGSNVLFVEHDLTRPTRYSRRAPKEG